MRSQNQRIGAGGVHKSADPARVGRIKPNSSVGPEFSWQIGPRTFCPGESVHFRDSGNCRANRAKLLVPRAQRPKPCSNWPPFNLGFNSRVKLSLGPLLSPTLGPKPNWRLPKEGPCQTRSLAKRSLQLASTRRYSHAAWARLRSTSGASRMSTPARLRRNPRWACVVARGPPQEPGPCPETPPELPARAPSIPGGPRSCTGSS